MNGKSLLYTAGVALVVVVAYEQYRSGAITRTRTA